MILALLSLKTMTAMVGCRSSQKITGPCFSEEEVIDMDDVIRVLPKAC